MMKNKIVLINQLLEPNSIVSTIFHSIFTIFTVIQFDSIVILIKKSSPFLIICSIY